MLPIKIAIASYGRQVELLEQIKDNIPENIQMIIINKALDDIVPIICKLEQTSKIDVFIASGGNAEYLKRYLSTPVVKIETTGTDVLISIYNALKYTNHIAVITYGTKLPETHIISELCKAKIEECVYKNTNELYSILNELKTMGVNHVVGGAFAIECADQLNMCGYYIQTVNGMNQAIQMAIKLAETNRQEKENNHMLNSILNFTHEGIVVTGQNNEIIMFNPSAEKITGLSREYIIGKKAEDVLLNTRLHIIAKTKRKELNAIQDMGHTQVLTNRVPIINDGNLIACLATFQSIDVLEKAHEKIRRKLNDKGFIAKAHFEDILGTSQHISKAKMNAKLYSRTDSTILIQGESGTGKDLFAQSIHNASFRSNKPFVAINCSSLSHSLLESELFGYEGGSFTGAIKEGKKGIFELADGGTIFLDEIGEINLDLQTKLLRVIEQNEVRRIGGEEMHPIDTRIIAATNKNIWQMVTKGDFRVDLYYRLNVLELKIPPLRDRPNDIPILLSFFLKRFCAELDNNTIQILSNNPEFLNYKWPGNVRELRNIVERFSVLYQSESIESLMELLPHNVSQDNNTKISMYDTEGNFEQYDRELLVESLKKCFGNKTNAAKLMGISRTTLWRKMKKYQIED